MSRKPYKSLVLNNTFANYAAHLLNYAKDFELWRLDIQKWARLKCRALYRQLLPKRNLVRPKPPLGEGSYLACAVTLADAIVLALSYEHKCENYIEACGRLEEMVVDEAKRHDTPEELGQLQLLQEFIQHQARRLAHLQQEICSEKYKLLQVAYPEHGFEELPASTFHLWHTFSTKEIDDTLWETMQLCESVHGEEKFPMVENPFCNDLLVHIYEVDDVTEEGYLLAKEKFKTFGSS